MAGKSAVLTVKILGDATQGRRALDDTASAADKFQRGLDKASVAAGVAMGGIAVAAGKAVAAASRLGESQNAVSKVFGASIGVIESFGATAAKSIGLSQSAFNELATSTGSLLTNMGYSTDQAAKSTTDLATRAADMASVFNTDVGTALNAINSGLRGEAEPLRAFGVSLSDAAVKSQAMTMGLYSGKGALDDTAKAQATVALVMEQTSKVAGDFAATSDGLANRQRIASASFEDTSAKLGGLLLPYYEQAVGLLQVGTDWVARNTGAVQLLVGVVGGLAAAVLGVNAAMRVWTATQAAVSAAQAIMQSRFVAMIAMHVRLGAVVAVEAAKMAAAWTAAKVKIVAQLVAQGAAMVAFQAKTMLVRGATVVWTAAQWLLNAALTANPVGIVVAAIAALVAGVILAYKKVDWFRAGVDGLGRILKTVVIVAVNGLKGAFDAVVGAVKAAWDWIGRMIERAKSIASALNPLKAIGGLFGKSAAPSVARSGGAGARSGGGTDASWLGAGNITLNLTMDARAQKIQLERYDRMAGRPAGQPLAPAW